MYAEITTRTVIQGNTRRKISWVLTFNEYGTLLTKSQPIVVGIDTWA